MIPQESQLETLVRVGQDKEIEQFFTSNCAKVPQVCGSVFESSLRRLAIQGITKGSNPTILVVLKVVKYLCEQNTTRGIHVLIQAGLPDVLVKIFTYITDNAAARKNVSSIFTSAMECIIHLNQLHQNTVWVSLNCEIFLGFICKCYSHVEMSTQVLITLNEILESQSNKGVTEIRNSLCSNPKFDQLCKEILCNINSFGDYSLQQLIIEAIIRLTSSGHRQHKSHEWNNDSQCAKLFRSISYQEFDKEARAYLNKVNQSTQDKWVLSYQCKSIMIGNLTFNESDDCWLDLCFRSKVIGFSFSHGTKLNYALESLTREDVDSVEVKDNGDEVKLTVKTKQQISILFEDDYFPPDCTIISCSFEKSLDLDSEKLRKKVNFILAKVAKVSKSNSMVKRGENGIMRQIPLNQPNTLVPGANHKALMPSNTQLSQNVVATSQPGGSYKTSKSSTYPASIRDVVGCRQISPVKKINQSMFHLQLQEVKVRQKPPLELCGSQDPSSQASTSYNSMGNTSRLKMSTTSIPYVAVNTSFDMVPETQGITHTQDQTCSSEISLKLSEMYNQPNIATASSQTEPSRIKHSKPLTPVATTIQAKQLESEIPANVDGQETVANSEKQEIDDAYNFTSDDAEIKQKSTKQKKTRSKAVKSKGGKTKSEQREPEQREPEQREPEQREPEQREPEQREPEQKDSEQKESVQRKPEQRDKVSHRRTRSHVDPGSRGGGKVISESKRRTKKQTANQVREELKELQNMDNEKEETANQKLNQSAFSSSEQSASSSDKQLVSLQKSKTPKKSDKHDHVVAVEQFSPPERIRHAEPTTTMAPPLELDMSAPTMNSSSSDNQTSPKKKVNKRKRTKPSATKIITSTDSDVQPIKLSKGGNNPKQKSRVTFDPYELRSESGDTIRVSKKGKPKRKTAKEKLFDSSGYTNESTGSELSWIVAHKNKTKEPDWLSEGNKKAEVKTYQIKSKHGLGPTNQFNNNSVLFENNVEKSTENIEVVSSPETARHLPSPSKPPRISVSSPETARHLPSPSKAPRISVSSPETARHLPSPSKAPRISNHSSSSGHISPPQLYNAHLRNSFNKTPISYSDAPKKITKLKNKRKKSPIKQRKTSVTPKKTPLKSPRTLVGLPCTSPQQHTPHLCEPRNPSISANPVNLPPTPYSPVNNMDNVDTSASDCSHISNVKTPMQPRRRRISSPMSNPRKVATTELPPLTDEIQIEIDRRQRNNSTPHDQTSTIDGNSKMGQKTKAVLNNSPQLSDPYESPPRTKSRKQPKKLNFPDANLFNPVGKRDFGKRPRNLVQESSSDLSGDDTSNMEDVVGQVGQMFRKRIRKKQRPAKRVCRALRDNAKKLREIWSRYSVKRTSELESFNAKFAELGNRQEDLMLNIRTLEADAHQYLTNLQGKYRDVMNQAQTSFVQFKNLQTHIATTQVENERKINRDLCRLSGEVTQNLAELTKQSPW